ncbi:MAG: SDR family NAD(P)-dependent oxidoreductase [Actinomycetota bacterium]|nr:SDR family NAD(P)-dependent oxidoreductase [Actinomycetota bacterium]
MTTGDVPRFAGKVAIVTGSTADPSIGRSCAVRLAEEGASVVINGRSSEQLRAAEHQLRDAGLAVAGVVGSLDDDTTVTDLVDTALDRFGSVDLIVNTVGGAPFPGPVWEMDRRSLIDTFSLNTWPTVALVKEAMARGLADGDGNAVVNISSGSPNKTTPSMIAYAAAKAALNALTRTMAADAGRRGVRVNAVSPGLTRTTATRDMWEADGGVGAGSHLLLRRLTTADDIASAALFLLSDDARQITGVVLDVDGGNHLQGGGWSPFAAAPQ